MLKSDIEQLQWFGSPMRKQVAVAEVISEARKQVERKQTELHDDIQVHRLKPKSISIDW